MTILNTYIVENPTFLGPTIWLPVVVGFIVGFLLVYNDTDDVSAGVLIGTICAAVGLFIGMLLSLIFGPFTETRRYEVTFDEETSIVEVMKDYNIVEQRGDIFVLEDKEGNE